MLDDPQVFSKIRRAALDGKNLEELSVLLGVSYLTVQNWSYENFRGFAEKWDGWKRDRRLALAEGNLDDLLTLNVEVDVLSMFGPVIDKNTGKPFKKVSTDLLKVKSKVSMFVSETLGSEAYSKKVKNENTDVTLEDLIDEAKKERENGRPSANDGDAFVDSEQEAPGAEISAQPGADTLPQQSDLGATAPNNNPQG